MQEIIHTMKQLKIEWTKTDLANIAELNGDYRKLDKVLSDEEKQKCNWTSGINRFKHNQATIILQSLFPFLKDEQIITLLYKQKTISQIL